MSLSDELKSEVKKAALSYIIKTIEDGILNKDFYNEILNQYVYYVKPNDSLDYYHHINECRSIIEHWVALSGIKKDSFEFMKYAFTLHFSDQRVERSKKHPHFLIQNIHNINREFLRKYFTEFIDKDNPITIWKSIFSLNSYRHIMDDTSFDICSKIVFESLFANPFFMPSTKPSKELINENTPFELLHNYEGQDFLEMFHWFLESNKTHQLYLLSVEQCEKILKNLIKTPTYANLFEAYIILKKYEVYFHIFVETRPKRIFYDILREIWTQSQNYKDPYECKEFPRVKEAMQACNNSIEEIQNRYKLNMYEAYLVTCKSLTLSEEICLQIEDSYQTDKKYAMNMPMFMALYTDIMKQKEKKK